MGWSLHSWQQLVNPWLRRGVSLTREGICSNNISREGVNQPYCINWEHWLVNYCFQQSLLQVYGKKTHGVGWNTVVQASWTISTGACPSSVVSSMYRICTCGLSEHCLLFCMIWGQHLSVNQRSLYNTYCTNPNKCTKHYLSGKTHTQNYYTCYPCFIPLFNWELQ